MFGGFGEIDPRAEAVYDTIRSLGGDVAAIARTTGIPEDIVSVVKQHLFVDEHDIAIGPNQVVRQRFNADADLGRLWLKAVDGELTGAEAAAFDRVVAHEYYEFLFMQQGLPYRSAAPAAWMQGYNQPTPEAFGAHDLAPRDDPDPWGHYVILEMPRPSMPAIPWRP